MVNFAVAAVFASSSSSFSLFVKLIPTMTLAMATTIAMLMAIAVTIAIVRTMTG